MKSLFDNERISLEAHDNVRFTPYQMACLEFISRHMPTRNGAKRICLVQHSDLYRGRVHIIEQLAGHSYRMPCVITMHSIRYGEHSWLEQAVVAKRDHGKFFITDAGRALGWGE